MKTQVISTTFLALISTGLANPASNLRATRSLTNNNNQVNCGGHSADKCSHCPFDFNNNFFLHGASWCHGDCVWDPDATLNNYAGTVGSQCRDKVSSDVDCGYYREVRGQDRDGFFRSSCSACMKPAGGVVYCGGDCQMNGDQCVPR